MSWVAVACSVSSAALGGFNKYISLEHHTFGQCSYCKRLPDTNQTHANCTSCGAPLPRSTTPTSMNYNNHDNRKKDEKKYATKKGVYNRPAPTTSTYTPPATDAYVPISFYHDDPSSASDTSSSNTSSSHCGSSDCGGSSDGGGCGGGE